MEETQRDMDEITALLAMSVAASPGSPSSTFHRALQFQLPDYTSPPLQEALGVLPLRYHNDTLIDEARAAAAAGKCPDNDIMCQISYDPVELGWPEDAEGHVGVVLYGGGLVDPRGYAPLAYLLATRYGIPTVLPIFNADLAFSFGVCDSGRLAFAQREFPNVEKWVLAGHSFGGVAATVDFWAEFQKEETPAAGLVLLASDIQQTLGCGAIDFSSTDIPMASLAGTEDTILNFTRWGDNQQFVSQNTLSIFIPGGNHGQFGAYNSTERPLLLPQPPDGDARIPPRSQWETSVSAMYHVVSQSGLNVGLEPIPIMAPTSFPSMEPEVACPPTDPSSESSRIDPQVAVWILLACMLRKNWQNANPVIAGDMHICHHSLVVSKKWLQNRVSLNSVATLLIVKS